MSPISNPALVPPGGLAGPAAPAPASPARTAPPKSGEPTFADALKQAGASSDASAGASAPQTAAAGGLQFSRHALARVQRRGITLDAPTLTRLSDGVARAASKGSRDSLVLVDDTAFVVSVPNRTVITAVGSQHMKDNVFTNIDSAVIA